MASSARIGIDLGGTKIAGILLTDDGSIAAQSRLDTPKGDYDKTVEGIAALVAELSARAEGAASVGIGIPGSLSPATGRVQNANSTWLNRRALNEDVEKAIKQPVRIANDANCFALSEATDGAGAGAASVFGVILGTGCGGGLVVEGRIVDGPRGIGGEWGHNPLPWPEPHEYPGPDCWCGRTGCMEAWISGPGLSADHARTHGKDLTAEEIAIEARKGNAEARESLHRHVARLARGLASVINLFDPARIVLGGGLSKMPHLYDELPALIAPHIFSDNTHVDISPPAHGSESGARGAAWLWKGPASATAPPERILD